MTWLDIKKWEKNGWGVSEHSSASDLALEEENLATNWKCCDQGFLWNYLIFLPSTQDKNPSVNGT